MIGNLADLIIQLVEVNQLDLNKVVLSNSNSLKRIATIVLACSDNVCAKYCIAQMPVKQYNIDVLYF